jgi:hypothetical protein
MSIVDKVITFRILSKLMTPFDGTNAFKLGIIDKDGKQLKKVSNLKTEEERESYTMLDRLVFNIKRLINSAPGGEKNIKNLVAGYYLIKENTNLSNTEELFKYITESEIILLEEYIDIQDFLNEDAPPNSTGPMVSSDEPVINKKKKIINLLKRNRL